ncbi:MAG: PrgI family protein [Patescibacteria group bacterium]
MPDMPQSNKQHPVPQNVMDVQFKLIGDLTMRQFAYLFTFGLAAYLASVVVIGIFKWPFVVFLALLALGLAFVPIEERGLDEWIVNFVRAVNHPTQRIWMKKPQLPTAFIYDSLAVVRQEMITLAPTSSRRKLEEYLKIQDEQEKEDPLDIPEREYLMKVRLAYPSAPTASRSSQVGVLVEEPSTIVVETLPESSVTPLIQEKPKEVKNVGVVVEGKEEPLKQEKAGVKEVTEITPAVQKDTFILPERFTPQRGLYTYEPMTPDMHSGRKFTNLTPSQGELILPIRGERVLSTSQDLQDEEDVKVKAEKLKELLDKIKQEEGLVVAKSKVARSFSASSPTEIKVDNEQQVGEVAEETVSKLRTQNEDLAKEIERLTLQIQRGKSMSLETSNQEQLLKRLGVQKEKLASSYTELRKQVEELRQKLEEQKTTTSGGVSQYSYVQPLTKVPNVVSGIVKDSKDKFLSDFLIIVKNKRGEAVRALKTNTMGQFVISTPLTNGTYTVEISPSNKTNLTFDIIPVEVKGEVLPPLEMIGR